MPDRARLSLLTGVVLVALLGFGALYLGATSDDPAATAASVDAAGLEQRVARLEADVLSLRAELAARPPRRGVPARADRDASDRAAARRIGRATADQEVPARAALIEALDEADPEIQDRIGALVQDQMEEQQEERRQRREQRFAERSAEAVAHLAEQVGLDARQVQTLNAALEAEREQTFALFRAAREDQTWGAAREKADAIRAQTDSDVAQTLDAEQLQAWQEMRDEEQERRRGR